MSTILVLCPYVPHPPTHGGSIRSRVLLDALAGHEVRLAAAVANDAERAHAAVLAARPGLTVHELPAVPAPRARFAAKLGCWLRGRSELLARRWARPARALVAALLRERPCDLVVADSSFVLPLLPRTVGRLLLHLHNLEGQTLVRSAASRPLSERITLGIDGLWMARTESAAIRRAAATVTVSEPDRLAAQRMAPGANVVCVPNSVDLDALPLLGPPPAGPPRLLFVGSFDYPPNLAAVSELVERHLPALRAVFPGLVVRLVGRDPAGTVARFRGRPGVELVGPADDLVPHYRDSHAVYLPIRSGGGTRIKILEAWALGRPVLATAIAAEGLGAVDGVHARRFETVDQGVAALRQVLATEAGPLVAAGRALVELTHSHRRAIAALRAVVDRALAAGPAPAVTRAGP